MLFGDPLIPCPKCGKQHVRSAYCKRVTYRLDTLACPACDCELMLPEQPAYQRPKAWQLVLGWLFALTMLALCAWYQDAQKAYYTTLLSFSPVLIALWARAMLAYHLPIAYQIKVEKPFQFSLIQLLMFSVGAGVMLSMFVAGTYVLVVTLLVVTEAVHTWRFFAAKRAERSP